MITVPLPARAPAPRTPLIAPPEARVYDLAQQARRVGLRIVHNPARGLELAVLSRAGRIPVGVAA